MTLAERQLRVDVAANLRRLMEFRDLFGEEFVGRQAAVCLRMLGGVLSDW